MPHTPELVFRLPNKHNAFLGMETERLVTCECIRGSIAQEIQTLWDTYMEDLTMFSQNVKEVHMKPGTSSSAVGDATKSKRCWTPEPWPEPSNDPFDDEGKPTHQSTDKKVIALRPEDYERARVCVNGCAGLNPIAYRPVVEALKILRESCTGRGCWCTAAEEGLTDHGSACESAQNALALAEQQP